MGKIEILTLISGVVLSITLALIVVPMFSNSEDMVNRHKLEVELIGMTNAIKMLYNEDSRFVTEYNNKNIYKDLYFYPKIKKYINGLQPVVYGSNNVIETIYSSFSKNILSTYIVYNSFQFFKDDEFIGKHTGKPIAGFSFFNNWWNNETNELMFDFKKIYENDEKKLKKICDADFYWNTDGFKCYFYL